MFFAYLCLPYIHIPFFLLPVQHLPVFSCCQYSVLPGVDCLVLDGQKFCFTKWLISSHESCDLRSCWIPLHFLVIFHLHAFGSKARFLGSVGFVTSSWNCQVHCHRVFLIFNHVSIKTQTAWTEHFSRKPKCSSRKQQLFGETDCFVLLKGNGK